MKTFFSIIALAIVSVSVCTGQVNNRQGWTVNNLSSKVFIENKGQFNPSCSEDSKILYGVANPGEHILFSKKGVTYLYTVASTQKKEEHEQEGEKYRDGKESIQLEYRWVRMDWSGANALADVTAENPSSEIFGYQFPDAPEGVLRCNTFTKIVYRNLYPGIDVEYTFHKDVGLKYNIIVHAGADASLIKMIYTDTENIRTDADGNIIVQSPQGNIVDHAPSTFYSSGASPISSSFLVNKNVVGFRLENYDTSKEIIIDPWVVSPGFTVQNRGYDVVRHAATGNIYILGGYPPYEVKKYTSAGSLIYTYVTAPIYGSPGGSNYYGDIEIDPSSGDFFISSGCCTGIVARINGASMALMWSSQLYENWRMKYNTSNNQLIVGGYVLSAGDNIAACDPLTGNIVNSAVIIAPINAAEVRAIDITPGGTILLLHVTPSTSNGNAVDNLLTSNSASFVNNYSVQDGYLLYELGALYAYNDNASFYPPLSFHGINGIANTSGFVYTYDGATIFKRDISNGSFIASVNVPNGQTDLNSGIAVDPCGNVFVGTQNGVSEFSANLNFVTSQSTAGPVFDVIIGNTNEVIATGNSFVGSFMFPCSQYYINTSSVAPSCYNQCTGTATAAVVGGVPPFAYLWSNSAITSSISSVCPGTYTVTVTDANNATVSATVTVVQPSQLLLTVATPPAICSGASASLSATATGGSPSYSFLWNPGNLSGSSVSVSPSSTTIYTVIVTDSSSCTVSATVTVTVNPLPVIQTSSPVSICVGASTVLTASGASSYLWSPCTNLNPCTGNTVTASPVITTTYSVTGTDLNGCSSSASVTVTVDPLPLVVTPPAPVICTGGSLNISLSGAANYHWSPQTGITSVSGPDSSSVTVSLTQTTCYTVTGYSVEGCSATTSFCVTVNPNPVPVIVPGGPVVFCTGGSVNLTATPVGTYLWNTSAATQVINVTTSGTFTVTVTDANGCSGISAPQSVTVNPNPTPVISPDGPTTFCAGGSVVLNCQPAYPGGSYLWSNSAVTPSINVSSGGIFTVTATDVNGCTGVSPPLTVTVNPLPVPSISPDGPVIFCVGGSVILTANGGTSYLWSNSSSSQNISVNTSGTFTVTVTDANGCTATASETVTVVPPPPALVSPAGPVSICTNNPALLSANTGNGYTYQWHFNGNPMTGEINPQISVLTTGYYSVVITDVNGCSSNSNVVQVTQGSGPIVTITTPAPFGCLQNTIYIGYGPQEIQLCAQAAAGAVSYLWSTGATTQCINVNTSGVYSVIAYDINGCPSPTPAVLNQPINVIDIRCGHGLKKIILCHVPEGNPGNPQTLCIGPPAVPPHLELHRYDCLGPCSLYYRNDNMIEADNFYVFSHPNPFSNGFNLTILTASSSSVTVNIHNMLGQVIETYSDVTEQTLIGTKLNAGIYFAEVIQDDNRQMIQIVKSE